MTTINWTACSTKGIKSGEPLGSFCTMSQWGGAQVESIILTELTRSKDWRLGVFIAATRIYGAGVTERERGEEVTEACTVVFFRALATARTVHFKLKFLEKLADSSYQELNGKEKGRSNTKLENV